MPAITLRFVTCNDAISYLIRTAEDFWASHVEALLPDGSGYLGAHADGGVQIRPIGYDKDTLQHEMLVTLPTQYSIVDAFYAGLHKHIGEPYDFESILGFLVRSTMHAKHHCICSALQTSELELSGYFSQLCIPAHEMSPRDLLLALSARIYIPNAAKPWKST